MSAARRQFGRILGRESIYFRITPFVLRAGGQSNWYGDLRAGLAWPQLGRRAARYILQDTHDAAYDNVAGIGVGGRALATLVSLVAAQEFPYRTNLKAVLGNDDTTESPVDEGIPNRSKYNALRLDPKNGYGFSPRRVKGRSVLAVDDMFTTGHSLETMVAMLRESGAEVDTAAVVADRSNGASAEVAQHLGLTIHRLFEFEEATGTLVVAAGPLTPRIAS